MLSDTIKNFVKTFSDGLSEERRLALISVQGRWAVVMTPTGNPTTPEQFAEVNANFGTLVQGLMILNPGVDQKSLMEGYLRELGLRAYASDPTLFVDESEVGKSQTMTAFETTDLAIVWYGLFKNYRTETFRDPSVPNAIVVVITGDEKNPHTVITPFRTEGRSAMITAEAASKAEADPVLAFSNAVVRGIQTDYPNEWGGLLYVFDTEADKTLRGVLLLPENKVDADPASQARDVALLKELLLGNTDVAELDAKERLSLFIRSLGSLLDNWVATRLEKPENAEAFKKAPIIIIRTRMTNVLLEAVDLFGPTLLNQIGTISGYFALANVGGHYRTTEHSVMRFATTPDVIDGCGSSMAAAVKAMVEQLNIKPEDDARFIYIPDSETTEITLVSYGEAAKKALEFARSAATDELSNKPGRVDSFLTSLYHQIRGSVDIEKVPPQADGQRFVGAVHAGPTLLWDLLDRLYGEHMPSMIKEANTVAIITGKDGVVRFIFTKVKF